jgi:hypothetical protein
VIDNYAGVVIRTFHATPATIVVRAMPSPQNSTNRYPVPADVRTGTIYGAGQYEQKEYLTGTMSASGGGGGTRIYPLVG